MYWNNPILELSWPTNLDPVRASLHEGTHCLFYDPAVDKNSIQTGQTLSDLCAWANRQIAQQGIAGFVQDSRNHYDIANLVKLNIWVDDLPRNGSIKPMLLQYTGQPKYQSGTGESRLRALERIPSITTAHAFISTHRQYQDRFDHLESVTSLDQFAQLCSAEFEQMFLFRLTDANAPYGLDWYEYNSSRTAGITPGQDYCVEVFSNYINAHSDTVFMPEWFDTLITWDSYKN